jgi:hypothetical protein
MNVKHPKPLNIINPEMEDVLTEVEDTTKIKTS